MFDYLVHSCCPATARQFARDAVVSLAPLLDADGDEVMHSAVDSSWEIEETLRQADVRGREYKNARISYLAYLFAEPM